MAALFGSKASKPAPIPVAATKTQDKQEERLAKQEKRAEEEEATKQRKIAASQRARRTGGMRMLLADREDAQTGLKTTLGVG